MNFHLLICKEKQFFTGIVLSLFIVFLFLTAFACAGTGKMVQVLESPENSPSYGMTVLSEPESELQGLHINDIKQQAYLNYILSSFHVLEGNYGEAINTLKKVMEIDPESGLLNKKMAILMYHTENIGEALKYAKKSLSITPQDTGTKLLLADLYAMIGNQEGSLQQYEEILSNDPENQRVRMIFATVLAKEGLFDRAIVQLDSVVEQNPDMAFAHYYKGRIFQTMKKIKMAEEEYLLALSKNSSMEPALFDLAGLYHRQGNLADAIDTYKRLLSLYPMNNTAREGLLAIYEYLGEKEDIDALMKDLKHYSDPGDPSRQAVGIYYLHNGRISESIYELDMITKAWPNDYRSRYYLGMAYEKDGQIEKALKHFRMIKKGSELFINAKIHIAYILNDKGNTDEAINVINETLEIKKDEADLYIILASFYETKNDLIKARETLYQGLEYDEDNIDLYFRLGIVFEKAGDKEAAVKQMRKVLELDPNHADSLNYVAYTYAEKGVNLDEAYQLIQRALEIRPENGYFVDSLGWVYFQKGQYEKALDVLKKAFSLSEDPTIAEHLGDVYLKINKYEKSIEMYKKALSLEHQFSEQILKKIEDIKKIME